MAKKLEKTMDLGVIELGSEIYVSDPCYDVGTWCQAFINGLKPGKYHGFMSIANFGKECWQGTRVTNLWIAHEDNIKNYPTKKVNGAYIGVDSGSAGIFDKDYYEKYHPIPDNNDESDENYQWYDKQFSLCYYYDLDGNPTEEFDFNTGQAIKREPAQGVAIDQKGVVSFSGFGDGGYDLYEGKNSKGEIISLRIKFI